MLNLIFLNSLSFSKGALKLFHNHLGKKFWIFANIFIKYTLSKMLRGIKKKKTNKNHQDKLLR